MSRVRYTGFAAIVSGDPECTRYTDADILTEDGFILGFSKRGSEADQHEETVDCQGLIAYPGLINTHHHFFQACVRNLAGLDWTTLSVMEWLDRIYPIFARLNEDCFYHGSLVSLADLVKNGCTTAFDHQYCFPEHAGKRLIDRQFEAAELLGMRFHAGRGCNTLAREDGSTIPEAMRETTEAFLDDCVRLIETYHDGSPGSMRQVVVAPCQPINSLPDTFAEAARLARHYGVSLHTHLGEGETAGMRARYGMDSLDWCAQHAFLGEDVWLAHGWEFGTAEIATLAATGTGISHCPAPVYLVGEAVTAVPAMIAAGVRVSLGVDGQASNDGSNLAECIRLAYLLQCLNAGQHAHTVPTPYDFLRMGASGGADCLNRSDLGELAVGKAADFFAIDSQRLDRAGAIHSPGSLPAKVGLGGPVDLTVVAGQIVWRNGEFPGLDEAQLAAEANQVFSRTLGDVAHSYGEASSDGL
ncbi:MAG: amidohydrolase [Pseudomonadota bacterium]